MDQGHEELESERFQSSDMLKGNGLSVGTREASDPEVVGVAKRRSFPVVYKLRILKEADACKNPREMGLLLRREGIYSSQLTRWRQRREKMANKNGRSIKAKRTREIEKENECLRRENAKLQFKLKRAEGMLDLQKKAAALFAHLDEQKEKSE
jgi:hypothetical protein